MKKLLASASLAVSSWLLTFAEFFADLGAGPPAGAGVSMPLTPYRAEIAYGHGRHIDTMIVGSNSDPDTIARRIRAEHKAIAVLLLDGAGVVVGSSYAGEVSRG